MQRVFISDLHLQDATAPRFLRFAECLTAEAKIVDEIYVLGDLVEMWIGDDDDSPEAQALSETLQRASAACPIYIMHGNRDFLFGEAFAKRTGCHLIEDPHLLEDGTLLTHGDILCTDDEAYQQIRTLLRSEAWQTDTLAKSLAERKAFGQGLREQSKSTNANKPANIMDVNINAFGELMQTHGATLCIHGHTHRPGIHADQEQMRIVLGAWERCGWLCRQQDGETTLECFSLARRYGT